MNEISNGEIEGMCLRKRERMRDHLKGKKKKMFLYRKCLVERICPRLRTLDLATVSAIKWEIETVLLSAVQSFHFGKGRVHLTSR